MCIAIGVSAILHTNTHIQGMKYEFVDVKKPSTVDFTCDGMSMDVNKVLYAAVKPHIETVKIKTDQDPSVTSSTAGTKDQQVHNHYISHYNH